MQAIKNLIPSISSGKLLSIDIGSQTVRALVLKKKGAGAVVLQHAAIERSGDDAAADIAKLATEHHLPKVNGVVVTDRARFLPSELTVEGVENLPQDKIDSAAMWEIEPYLDFPPSDGLFHCRVQPHLKNDGAVPALILAMEGGEYSQLAHALKRCGATLQRAYAPEGALAYATQWPAKGSQKVIIDYRRGALKGVLLTDQGPSIFQELPIDEGMEPSMEPVRNMVFDITASASNVEEVVVSGSMISPELIEMLRTDFGNLRPWGSQDIGNPDAHAPDEELDPQFALAAGAAIQEVGIGGEGLLGVTDRVPLLQVVSRKFRDNKRLAPAITVGVLLVFLAGHHALTKTSIARYNASIKQLKAEKSKLLRPREEQDRLKKALAEVRQKQTYLETVLPTANDNMLNLLDAVVTNIPKDIVLNKLYRKIDGTYCIQGNAFRGRSVSRFNKALAKIQGCKSTNLETIRRLEEASDTRQKLLPYDFSINLKF